MMEIFRYCRYMVGRKDEIQCNMHVLHGGERSKANRLCRFYIHILPIVPYAVLMT